MNILSKFFRIGFLMLLAVQILYAQELTPLTIKGRIFDEITNEPLPYTLIHVEGTNDATETDSAGNYFLTTTAKLPFTLKISFTGYTEKKIEIYEEEPELNISLRLENSLSTVVIVGYGTSDRKTLTSSISTINADDVKQIPVAGFNEQLQGKASGLQVNSNTGIPGDGAFVRVRGTTSINSSSDPLYIVDGVFVNNTSLQTLNTGGRATSPLTDISPSEIESIEVLKDAGATAIYGSRGANGVIIITTKRGSYESKPKVSFNTSQGWAKAPKLLELTTGTEHATLVNEYWINSGIDNPALNQTYANRPFRPASEVINGVAGRGTPEEQQTYDRQSDVYRVARLQNYDLSVSGGTKNTRYYVAGSYTKQEAIVRPAYFERGNFRFNIDHDITKKVRLGFSSGTGASHRNQVRAADGPQGGLLQAATQTPTYLPKTLADGTPARWAGFDNLDVLINNYDVHTRNLRNISNLYFEADLLKNLKFKTSWGIDYNNYNENEYWNTKTQLGTNTGSSPVNGLATSSKTINTAWINEQTLSYKRSINPKNTFGILLGNTLQSSTLDRTFAQGTQFPNDNFKKISAAAVRTSTENYTQNTLASFFTRVDYSYANKYFVELTARADGSSRFGANNKWGYFPAIGVAWRVKEERFLKDVKFISDLKLRASYGIVGNQSGITDFASRGLWTGGASYTNNGTSDVAGTAPFQLANKDLRWEKTNQGNIGLDVALLKGRVALEFNLYSKYTTDALLRLPLAATTGYTDYFSNTGEISNKGYEFSFTTINVSNKSFKWETNFSISGNKNKIEKLPIPITQYSRDWIRLEEGSPLFSFWLYKQLYVDPQTGQAVFEDVNNDGQITVADRQILGNAAPKFFGGFNNTIKFKNFDLGILLSYQYGNKVFNLMRFFGEGGGSRDANRVINKSNLDRWTTPGQITNVPRVTSVGNNYRLEQNSRFLEDGSFLRLRSLTLGYTLPKNLTQKAKVETFRIYVAGSNLFTWTKYTGQDPEANVSSNQNIQGLDQGTPPQPRSVQVGFNVTF